MPCVNTEAFTIHLASIAEQAGNDAHVILLLDQAGWHRANHVKCPDNITLLPLPPYSPELNPAEQPWKAMRQDRLSNRVFLNLDDLELALTDAWLVLANDPQRITSMCLYPWINNAYIN